LLILLGYLALRPAGTSPGPEAPGGTTAPENPLKASLHGRVWASKTNDLNGFVEGGDPQRQGLDIRDAAPLRLAPRDWLRLEWTLNRPAFLYLVWIDTEGHAEPLYPWLARDWQQRPEREEARDRLSFPLSNTRFTPLGDGPPGIETILLFARKQPLTATEHATLVEGLRRPKLRRPSNLAVAVWLQNGERAADDRGAPPAVVEAESGDAKLQVRELLRELRPVCPDSWALCVGNRGKN
jgi:hypothetical protein